jgi:hypothetical protein
MQKILFYALICCGLLMGLSGCESELSDTVDQDKIYILYELFYNKNEDKTYARATFQFSNALGTKLQLAGTSEIRFNNDLLTFQPVLAYYEKEYAGQIGSGTFVWRDTNNKTYTNTISGMKSVLLPSPIPVISKTNSTSIVWVGDALGSGERMVVSLNSSLATDLQIFQTNNIGATSVILASNQLQVLPTNQDVTAIIRRYNDVAVTQKTSAGANMFTHYQGTDVLVRINP